MFSAVISAFIVEARKELVPPSQDRVILLLQAMYNQSKGLESNVVDDVFYPPSGAIVVNILFFVGLTCSLLAGLGGLLVKQWARQSVSSSTKPKATREVARNHHRAWAGLLLWRVNLIVALIPMLLHIALLQSFIGILWWLFYTNTVIFAVLLYLFGVAAVIYVALGISAAVNTNAPFKWPFSALLTYLVHSFWQNRPEYDPERGSLAASALAIPVSQPVDFISIDKYSLQLKDNIDADIFSDVLDHAANRDEICSILAHLYQIAVSGSLNINIVTPRLIELSLARCDDLAARCCDFEQGSPIRVTIRNDSLWQAHIGLAYLRWMVTSLRASIDPTVPVPRHALRMIRAFPKTAIKKENLEDLQLGADVMHNFLHAFPLAYKDLDLEDHLCIAGTKLLLKMAPPRSDLWESSIDGFQARVTAYLWPITLFVMRYALHQATLASQEKDLSNASNTPQAPVNIRTWYYHSRLTQRSKSVSPQVGVPPISNSPIQSYLDYFPPSTPPILKEACRYQRKLLGATDKGRLPGRNYPILKAQLLELWIEQGANDWAFVWLQGIMGPLRMSLEETDGVRGVSKSQMDELSFEFNTGTFH